AEATDCRRVRLLAYFGEVYGAAPPAAGPPQGGWGPLGGQRGHKVPSVGATCGNCDNCLNPPPVWDGTDAARKLLSTIYRVHAASGLTFGTGHIMDIVRGKDTEKVQQFGHDKLSTFGLGKEYTEAQLRGVLRQLLATGAVGLHKVSMENGHSFDTLTLTDGSRPVLRGEQSVLLREATAHAAPKKARRASAPPAAAANLGQEAQVRFINLKAWRAEVAREHNLPAYVIFHDATLAAIAERCPATLDDLQGISGMGAKKLEAYGEDVLRVVRAG
ncbi:MAG TPA: RQC domain-containing protein, partial [Giesbergeria sp.]|nr:RQC domain-containing protein [Giesbergeria sp.]